MNREQILQAAIRARLVAAGDNGEHYSPFIEDSDITDEVLQFAANLGVVPQEVPELSLVPKVQRENAR